MAALNLFKLSLLLSLFSYSTPMPEHRSHGNVKAFPIPAACRHTKCPSYRVYNVFNGFEIRRYGTTVWMSTSPVGPVPLEVATSWGYQALHGYARGQNYNNEKMNMTAPVIIRVNPCDGSTNPCVKTYASSLYSKQPRPPLSQQLLLQNWATTYVAVRRFTKPVSEYTVRAEAFALFKSLTPSLYLPSIMQGEYGQSGIYSVAQYTSTIYNETVNEIWIKFPDGYRYAM